MTRPVLGTDPLRLNPTARRERLNQLASQFGLDNPTLGRIMGRTSEAVRTWRTGKQQVPEPSLRLLELELGTREPRGVSAGEP